MSYENKIEEKKLYELLAAAKWGWWKADFYNKTYICSEIITDLLGLDSTIISFSDFKEMIRHDYQSRITNEFSNILIQDIYDQIFPVQTKYGIIWIRSQLGQKEKNPEGHLIAWGFIQCISDQDKPENIEPQHQVNNLLYQQNSISRSLLSFLKTEDTNKVITKTLHDILEQFHGERVYIFEYDWNTHTQNCTFEVAANEISKQKENLQNLPMSSTKWWTQQISNYTPIILFNLNELPKEAANEKELLEQQGIKSLMVVPMLSRDNVRGFLGIDIVNSFRNWNNNDYQWFASLSNFISICMELRKSEYEAQNEREYFRNLYQHMPLGYVRMKILYDENNQPNDYLFVDANPAFEKIIEKSALNFLGKTASSIKVPRLKEELQFLAQALNCNQDTTFELPHIDKHCHGLLYSPDKDEVVSLFSDITDTIHAHEALDRSEKTLRNIYKNIPVGIEVYDKNGILRDMNDKDVEIFELQDKSQGLGINLFQNPNVPDEIKEQIRAQQDVDFVLKYSFSNVANKYYQTNGTGVKDLIVKTTALYDANNNLENYILIIIDNTATSTAHSRIKDFEDLFSMVADFAKIGYFKWNPLTQTGFAISQWFKNWGEPENRKLSDIIGIYSNLHPHDAEELKESYDELLTGKKNKLSREVRVKNENNEWKWLRCNITVKEFDPANNNIELIGTDFDITEMKDTQQKLIEAKNKAETLDKLKSAFLANMSHEIRTPLNAIVGFSSLLTETLELEDKLQYISIIQENNELLLQLISDILDLSKMEAGTFDIVYGNTDINVLCQEIIRSMKIKTPEKIELLFENHMPECYIKSDRNRLNQLLSNFINNALKFTHEGSISIGYNILGNEIEFYVRDTGIGIASENLNNIFERFVKLNSFVRGTGLGLSICKNIVEQMNGRIGVESKEGIGSRFWFILPYNPINQEEITPSKQKPVTKTTNPLQTTILVAEDNDSNFFLLSTILKKTFHIIWAKTGAEALKMYKEHAPELILMDIKMPEMDGLTATKEIRKTDTTTPIIALTAFAFDSDKIKTIEAGCNDYLTKPINANQLKETIKKYIK